MNKSIRTSRYFRADIEGLRAVAILLVVAAHYGIPGLRAGFIGVDIFFVLSGYLITGILVREREDTGRIALLRFYANRLRRLLPALATMVVVASTLVWWQLPIMEQPAQTRAGAAAMFWVSNFFFAYGDVDYFAAEASSNVFLHTWSLGVEEQFYLVWPLLIGFSFAVAKGEMRRMAGFWLIIAVMSLALCLSWSFSRPMLAFYMMPARAWQFAAGALTWLCVRHMPSSSSAACLFSWGGVLLILLSLTLIKPAGVYPGFWALLPTLAVSMLLWAGSGPLSSVITKALATRPMQAIGGWSYALYLWHWPVLLIGEHFLPIRGELRNGVLALGISLLATILTHRLVENPIRFGRAAKVQHGWQIVGALSLMVMVNVQMLRWNKESREVIAMDSSSIASRAMFDVPIIYQDGCDDWYFSDTLNPCVYGNGQSSDTVVLLGDSIGAQWFPALVEMFDPSAWKIVVLTKSSCPIVDAPFFYQRIGREFTECAIWRDRAISWLNENPARYVFIGSAASADFNQAQWVEGTRRILDRIAPAAETILVIESSPVLNFNGPACLQRRGPDKCRGAAHNQAYEEVSEYLQQAVDGDAKYQWIETASYVCPLGRCETVRTIGGREVPVFRDNQHLTASFSATAAQHFLQQISSIRKMKGEEDGFLGQASNELSGSVGK